MDLEINTTPVAYTNFEISNFKEFVIKVFQYLNPATDFLDNWHIDYLVESLSQIENGEIKRLVINVPPRSLKSTIISVAWPAWILAQNPAKRIIVASYSSSISVKLSEECRLIMESAWYKNLYPESAIIKGRNKKDKFYTQANGFRFATSIAGTLTGEGADILIVDDPQTPMHAESQKRREVAVCWFDQTFTSRLNDKKKGAIVVIMQRLHQQDLSAHLLKKGIWKHIKIPAVADSEEDYQIGKFSYHRTAGELLHTAREDVAEIENAKLELGAYAFSAQYQQEPISASSKVFSMSWIKRYSLNNDYAFELIYQSWDTAYHAGISADYSVCTTWGILGSDIYLLHVCRTKRSYPDLKSKVLSLWEDYTPNMVLIENKSSGQSLIEDLRKSPLKIKGINPTKDKLTRFIAVTPFFESGKIYLPDHSSWLAEFETELSNFPDTKHDDQVDSMTQFLNWYRSRENNNKTVLKNL